MKKVYSLFLISTLSLATLLNSCTKDPDIVDNDPTVEQEAKFSFSISDAKAPHSRSKSIIQDDKLSKCEITISEISLKSSDGDYSSILDAPVNANLRQLQGIVKNLVTLNIPLGTYTDVRVSVSGVDITYDGNNYSAAVEESPEVTISDFPGTTFGTSHGVTDAFQNGEITFALPLDFTLVNSDETVNVRLFFDASSSVYEIPITYQSYSWVFAGFRTAPNVNVILEQGVQQIKYSPPFGINPVSASEINYYGIHTFKDFNTNGGTINSHTSQHVFRGDDGSLIVDAEVMASNSNQLVPSEISASQNTDVRADETFNLSSILSTLSGKGYNLESGKYYYFSLRKTWNITTDGQTYDLTRTCEPMPVLIP